MLKHILNTIDNEQPSLLRGLDQITISSPGSTIVQGLVPQ